MRETFGQSAKFLPILLAFLTPGCDSTTSTPSTVRLPVGEPTRQTAGNCWIHTFTAWAEALVARSGNPLPEFSASYLTYRYLEDALSTAQWGAVADVSGNFLKAALLARRHGLMRSDRFRGPHGEAPNDDSAALASIQESLRSGGVLARDLSPETIRSELDRAFGVRMASLTPFIEKPSEIAVTSTGDRKTLDAHLLAWQPESWSTRGPGLPHTLVSAFTRQSFDARQINLGERIKRALGSGYALPVTWWIDLNALDDKGIFSAANWKIRGEGMGIQGGHSTLLVDYEAEMPDGTLIPEGDVTPLLRSQVEREGRITAFIVRNSWGARPGAENHPTYSYLNQTGFTRLEADYLFAWLPEAHPLTGALLRFRSGFESVVLPPGF